MNENPIPLDQRSEIGNLDTVELQLDKVRRELEAENQKDGKEVKKLDAELEAEISSLFQTLAIQMEKIRTMPDAAANLAKMNGYMAVINSYRELFYKNAGNRMSNVLKKSPQEILGSMASLEEKDGLLWYRANFITDHAEDKIGLGDCLTSENKFVLVWKKDAPAPIIGRRSETEFPRGMKRVGYDDPSGNYIAVLDGEYFQGFSTLDALKSAQERMDKEKQTTPDSASKIPNPSEAILETAESKSPSSEIPAAWQTLQDQDFPSAEKEAALKDQYVAHEDREEQNVVAEQQYGEEKFADRVGRKLGFVNFEMGEIPSEQILIDQIKDDFEKEGYQGFSFEQAKAAFDAIANKESGGNYSALGDLIPHGPYRGQKALGKYQIMEGNWEAWARDEKGSVLPPTPLNQERVAFQEICKNLQKWLQNSEVNSFEHALQLAAVDWYGWMEKTPGPNLANLSNRRPFPNHPTPREYAADILSRYENLIS